MTSGTSQWLQGVWGTSSDDAYAVGVHGTVLHYDGAATGRNEIVESLTGGRGVPAEGWVKEGG